MGVCFFHSAKVNINQDCTTNSSITPFGKSKVGYRKILLLAGSSIWRDVGNIPIAETKEINEKVFQMVVWQLNFKTIHY